MGDLLDDLAFSLRHYPLEHLLMAVLAFGCGLFVGAAVMRWALS